MNFENQQKNAGGNEWILYNGTQVIGYAGKDGDRSTVLYSYKGTSGTKYANGVDYQMAMYQNVPDEGPVPEGWYKIDLTHDPSRIAKADKKSGELLSNRQGGIEKIPAFFTTSGGRIYTYEGWGTWRASLQPVPGTKTYGRFGFYFHDSRKGYSHGCIETNALLFSQLIRYRQNHLSINVLIDYPNPYCSSTYGYTDQ